MTESTTKDDKKAARLAAALRTNLRKRKEQARGDVPGIPPKPPSER
jgi:hypothetical protein